MDKKIIINGLEYDTYYNTYTAKSVRETGLPYIGGKGGIPKSEYIEKYINIWLSKSRCNKLKKPVLENERPVAYYKVMHGFVPLYYRG